jgi:hypothetical protein
LETLGNPPLKVDDSTAAAWLDPEGLRPA